VDYVNFGAAGVKVSRLALGMGLRGQTDEAAAQRLVEHALDQGINLIDCANVYGMMDDRANIGRSEVVLGRALKGKRDDVVITSKVCGRLGPGPNDLGLSRFHILREVERSLKRLDTDHLDVYLVHSFDQATPQEETIRALDDLVHSGKVRYVGCCNYAAWQVCRALWIADKVNAMPYMCVQNPYSLLNRRLEQEMFGLVRDRGLGVMAYSPLAVGLLSGAYKPGEPAPTGSLWATRRKDIFGKTMEGVVAEVVKTVHDVAADLGKTPAQVALAWVLSHPEITVAISGADTIEQLNDNLGGIGWLLPAEVRTKLDAVSAALSMILD
jgi:aryl-alcohol dehydrogenase-like predicted oxidoreductase